VKGTGKYYDGKKPLSHSCEWEFLNNHFVIRSDDLVLASWSLDVVLQDLDQNTTYVLRNTDTEERLEITSNHTELPGHLFKRKKVSFNGKVFALMIFLIVVTIFGIWTGLPHFTKFTANQISPEEEKAMEKLYNISSIGGVSDCLPTNEAKEVWGRFVKNLTVQGDHSDIMIVDHAMVNAFTLPGRKIVILSGLLRNVESPEELAGILAHELGHVHHKHIIQKIVNALTIGAIFQFVSGDFSGAGIDPATVIGVSSLTFDRNMETEADDFAFKRLELKQVNPSLVQKFFKRNTLNMDKLSFLSSHPGDEERIKRFSQKSRTKPVPLMSEKEWKVLKTYCKTKS
jgi:predicted Zn-dependent protease